MPLPGPADSEGLTQLSLPEQLETEEAVATHV